MTISILMFIGGICVGALLGYALVQYRFATIKKKFDDDLQKISEKHQQQDQEALVKFQTEYNKHLALYRSELDKLIVEEALIKAEVPDAERLN